MCPKAKPCSQPRLRVATAKPDEAELGQSDVDVVDISADARAAARRVNDQQHVRLQVPRSHRLLGVDFSGSSMKSKRAAERDSISSRVLDFSAVWSSLKMRFINNVTV
jgi:hypothetical protein